MQSRRHKASRRTIEESGNVDRWLVSYADFITLLFAFFVVMYAISSVNEGKYRVLSDTMVAAFNTPPKSLEPIQVGKPIEKFLDKQPVEGIPKPITVEPTKQIDQQALQMARIAEQVKASLQPLIDKKLIKVESNNLWVEVEINTSILYSSGSATLENAAYDPLRKLALVLMNLPNYVDVEGHTDNQPIKTSVFPSNWELSAARAASVVRLFIDQGMEPDRLAAIGFSEFHPVGDNKTFDGRNENRRVKIIILADKNARHIATIDAQLKPVVTGTSPASPASPASPVR